jgi:hypothetical protein
MKSMTGRFEDSKECPSDLSWEKHVERYQYQPWYIKLWRHYHYLSVPWEIFIYWITSKKKQRRLNFDLFLKILIGEADIRMKWYYTSEEVFGKLRKKIKDD